MSDKIRILKKELRSMYWGLFWQICGTIFYAVLYLSLWFETYLVRGFVRGLTGKEPDYHTLFHYVSYSTIIVILLGIILIKDIRRQR